MWQKHVETLLNRVNDNSTKEYVLSHIESTVYGNVLIRNCDVIVSLKSTNACGLDGLAVEHFIFAREYVCTILTILFNSILNHSSLPETFMKSSIVPFIKNKTRDTTDKNNYRPIAVVIAPSKVFESSILNTIEPILRTSDNQLGCKRTILRIWLFMYQNLL